MGYQTLRCLLLFLASAQGRSWQQPCPYRYMMLQVHACNGETEAAWSLAGLAFKDETGKNILVPAARGSAFLHQGRAKVPASFGFQGSEPWNALDGNPFTVAQVDDTYSLEGEVANGRDLHRPTLAAKLIIDFQVPKQVASFSITSRRDGHDETHPRKWTLRGSNDLTSWANLSSYDLDAKPFPEGTSGYGRQSTADIECGELE
ncbi:unnamed protein product [Effrenium voratum]|uniref:Discoidin domain-containing protein n=2 Tax=Effrenium voratum TaxID=2562239 RepID=A0AA36JDK9_9DINO|nr:unnamed protein product [Effrenium voratum]CAJ1424427.1 unnamed protein product [Effrenium voratum]|mmetsp:Transcript_30063/g.71522  ORF Transcript_30063/g.71522 Transcript_30063/m.71522 type:complete len:204 (-) Transcript_30063:23-634(-)